MSFVLSLASGMDFHMERYALRSNIPPSVNKTGRGTCITVKEEYRKEIIRVRYRYLEEENVWAQVVLYGHLDSIGWWVGIYNSSGDNLNLRLRRLSLSKYIGGNLNLCRGQTKGVLVKLNNKVAHRLLGEIGESEVQGQAATRASEGTRNLHASALLRGKQKSLLYWGRCSGGDVDIKKSTANATTNVSIGRRKSRTQISKVEVEKVCSTNSGPWCTTSSGVVCLLLV